MQGSIAFKINYFLIKSIGMKKTFLQKVELWFAQGIFLMAGLDILKKHIPKDFMPDMEPEARHTAFIKHFVDLTAAHCLGWKPNLKFYLGSVGMKRLEEVCAYISEKYPDHINLGDPKDGDIGNTNEQSLDYYTNELKLDAFTLNPLMGFKDSMNIFLNNADISGFILCLTSNEGSGDLLKTFLHGGVGEMVYERIASYVADAETWNKNKNLNLVVGATNTAAQVAKIRAIAGDDAIFLMPGFGAQGGDPEVLKAARNSKGTGFFAVVARDLIAPKQNEGESYDDAVTRQAEFYKNLFAVPQVA